MVLTTLKFLKIWKKLILDGRGTTKRIPMQGFEGIQKNPEFWINSKNYLGFLDIDFTAQEIASILNVSKKTIDRCRSQYNLRAEISLYSDISLDDLTIK